MDAKLLAAAAAGAAAAAVAMYLLKRPKPSGFLSLVAEAEATIGAENILPPAAAKALIAATPGALLLDVQDGCADTVCGSHSCSLGTLPFKASTDLDAFKDPKIADRPKDKLIVVNCGLGGQAKLGAALLKNYGFTNVKTIDGGCDAYFKVFPPAAKPERRG